MKGFNVLRPFVPASLFCILASFTVVLKSNVIFVITVVGVVTLLVISIIKFKKSVHIVPAVVALILTALTLISGAYFEMKYIAPSKEFNDKEITVSGTIQDKYFIKYSHRCYLVKLDGNYPVPYAEVPYGLWEFDVGDTVNIAGSFVSISDSMRSSYLSRDIYGCIVADKITVTGYKKSVNAYLKQISGGITERIYKYLPEYNAGFVNALTTGDKDGLYYMQSKFIRNAGVSHLVVVSGLHLGIICGALYWTLRKLRISEKLSAVLSIIAVLTVMGVCGFTPSVMRAGLAYIIFMSAKITSQKADGINSLAVAICIIILLSPFAIGSLSLQLSATSTLCLMAVSPRLAYLTKPRHLKKKCVLKVTDFISNCVVMSLSATVFVFPMLIYYFSEISLAAVPSNLMLSIPVNALLYFTVLAVIFPPFISEILFVPVKYISDYCLWVTEVFGADGKFCININSDYWFIALAISCVLMYLLVKVYNKKKNLETDEEDDEYDDGRGGSAQTGHNEQRAESNLYSVR